MKWSMTIVLAALGAAGCGEVEKAAAPDAGAGLDAAAGRCNPAASFTGPTALTDLNTGANEHQGRLSADELTVFFTRESPQPSDIYAASRTTRDAAFTGIQPLSALNSPATEFGAMVTANGLTVYFSSDRTGSAGLDLYVASRPSVAAAFSGLAPVGNLNTSANEFDPYVMPDGSALYWWVADANGRDVWTATLSGGGFSAPARVLGLGGAGTNSVLAISPDQRTIYFASTRADPDAKGDTDVWVATRASATGTFGLPRILKELNTPQFDAPTWVSDDGCLLYMFSSRAGSMDLYVARRGR